MTIESQSQVIFHVSRVVEYIDLGNDLDAKSNLVSLSILCTKIDPLRRLEDLRTTYDKFTVEMMKAVKRTNRVSVQAMIEWAIQRVCLVTRGSQV